MWNWRWRFWPVNLLIYIPSCIHIFSCFKIILCFQLYALQVYAKCNWNAPQLSVYTLRTFYSLVKIKDKFWYNCVKKYEITNFPTMIWPSSVFLHPFTHLYNGTINKYFLNLVLRYSISAVMCIISSFLKDYVITISWLVSCKCKSNCHTRDLGL